MKNGKKRSSVSGPAGGGGGSGRATKEVHWKLLDGGVGICRVVGVVDQSGKAGESSESLISERKEAGNDATDLSSVSSFFRLRPPPLPRPLSLHSPTQPQSSHIFSNLPSPTSSTSFLNHPSHPPRTNLQPTRPRSLSRPSANSSEMVGSLRTELPSYGSSSRRRASRSRRRHRTWSAAGKGGLGGSSIRGWRRRERNASISLGTTTLPLFLLLLFGSNPRFLLLSLTGEMLRKTSSNRRVRGGKGEGGKELVGVEDEVGES